MACDNVTNRSVDENLVMTPDEKLHQQVSIVVYGYALPCVCICGIIGNTLNLIILTRRKLRKSIRSLEQSANMCLISLALADLMCCLFAFPTMFLTGKRFYPERGFLLYYEMCSAAIISAVIMVSTWITVTMAIERYLAICHPLSSGFLLTPYRTKVVLVNVYVLSAVFNIPVLWRYQIRENLCENATFFSVEQVLVGGNTTTENFYRSLWAAVGNFIPLILLLYCNVCLCRKIHKSYKLRKKFQVDYNKSPNDTGNTLTVILIVIVLMFFTLVAPSEIVKQITHATHNEDNFKYLTIEVITNFMQSLNFAGNFVMYIILSPYFRRVLKQMFCTFNFSKGNNMELKSYVSSYV
ncbi:probable G-protein coupled receptor B0563.6 [Liolophura sinensis]|uniref:probable G-protein coupled receptor B0563.6 n=1 Tax=Liolophura sinensis TaxID=3198878 RepID=UPI0031586F58